MGFAVYGLYLVPFTAYLAPYTLHQEKLLSISRIHQQQPLAVVQLK